MRRRGYTIFWPQYFDKNRSINEGRRVPTDIATDEPSVDDIYIAAKKMKLRAEIDPYAKYPRSTWDDPGLVMIRIKDLKKQEVLKKLAPLVQTAKNNRLKRERQPKGKKNKKSNKQILMEKIAEQNRKKKAAKNKK